MPRSDIVPFEPVGNGYRNENTSVVVDHSYAVGKTIPDIGSGDGCPRFCGRDCAVLVVLEEPLPDAAHRQRDVAAQNEAPVEVRKSRCTHRA